MLKSWYRTCCKSNNKFKIKKPSSGRRNLRFTNSYFEQKNTTKDDNKRASICSKGENGNNRLREYD